MERILALATLGMVLLAVALPAGGAAAPQRRLLVFAPDAASSALTVQRRLLARTIAALRERDVTVTEIIGPSALRHRYHVRGSGFAVLLIGKDGGIKLRSAEPVPLARLAETIDAMPMRQAEMAR